MSYTITIKYGQKAMGLNWTMWLNGVLNPSNPLAENLIDNDIDNTDWMDPGGPSPFENNDNNFIVSELNFNCDIKIIWQFLIERFDLLAPSTQMGIGTSIMVKEHVSELLLGEWIQASGKKKLYSSKVLKEFKKYNVVSR